MQFWFCRGCGFPGGRQWLRLWRSFSFGLSLSFVSSLTLHFLAFDKLRSRLTRVVIPSCFGFWVFGFR